MKDILFNPSFEYNKFPTGAVKVNDEIKFTISITQAFNFWDLQVVLIPDGKKTKIKYPLFYKSTPGYKEFECKFKIEEAGIYWYHFEFYDCYGLHYITPDENMDACLSDKLIYSFQLSVHNGFDKNLDWFKGGVMYQIMPDRFCNLNNDFCHKNGHMHKSWNEHPDYMPVDGIVYNNDFFGGNINGIISKLDYIEKLGVKAIYLNPISLSFSNHRYDTADYLTLDPTLGSEDDFKKLCKECKKRGIGIILDGVFNHTGSDSIYFNRNNTFKELGAYQSKESKYYDWYKFIEYPDTYYSWWGFETLPSVNQDSSFVDFITNEVIKKWVKLGAKGYRLDVVDELNGSFVEKISKSLKEENKNAILIGEVWEDASNKEAYGVRRHYFDGLELDSVMNYPLRKAIIDFVVYQDSNNLRNTLRSLNNNYPKEVLDCLMNILSTHDTERILSICGNVEFHKMNRVEIANFKMPEWQLRDAIKRLKLAVILQYTLPGVPCIYYGDEALMEGYKDPFCRKTFPWNNINEDLNNLYIKLGKIRKENKEFKDGRYYELYSKPNEFAFRREQIYIIVNASENTIYYDINAKDLLTDESDTSFEIYPFTARILKRY